MRKVFVLIPPKYGLSTDEVRAYELQIEKIAHKAEKILDEYVELVNMETLLNYFKEDNSNGKSAKGFIFNSLYSLCNADLAIFAGDWEHSKECRLLHTIAVGFDIPIINIDTTAEGTNT